MKKSYYFKNLETFIDNSDVGSLHQESITIGILLELGTASPDGSSFKTITENSTAPMFDELNESTSNLLAIRVRDWILPDEQEDLTYPDSGIEQEILSTGIIFETSLPNGYVYLLALPSNIAMSESSVILSYIRDVFWKKGLHAVVVSETTHNHKYWEQNNP